MHPSSYLFNIQCSWPDVFIKLWKVVLKYSSIASQSTNQSMRQYCSLTMGGTPALGPHISGTPHDLNGFAWSLAYSIIWVECPSQIPFLSFRALSYSLAIWEGWPDVQRSSELHTCEIILGPSWSLVQESSLMNVCSHWHWPTGYFFC